MNKAARNHIKNLLSFYSDETTGEFVEVEGTWYFIDKDAKTIDDAYSACSGMSGKLWEPNTLDIMNGVHAEVLSLGLENVGIWVGITDEGSDGEFYYKSTGEAFPFEVKIHDLA